MAPSRLSRYVLERDALLRRVVVALQADDRVVAAWLAGSFGRDEGDAWGDLDLQVILADESLRDFLADRRQLYSSLGEVVFIQDEIPGQGWVGDQFHLLYFATPVGPIEVDWSFLPASSAQKPLAHRILIEKQPIPTRHLDLMSPDERAIELRRWAMFFWAMAPIAVRLCGRGQIHRAVRQLDLLSRALISVWRLLDEEGGSRPWLPDANRPIEDKYDARLPKLGRLVSPKKVLEIVEAHCREADQLQARLSTFGANVDAAVIDQTREMIVTTRHEIAASRYLARRYR